MLTSNTQATAPGIRWRNRRMSPARKVAARWDAAWDAATIVLVPVPKHFLRRGLEGGNEFSRRVVRQFVHSSCVYSEEMYDRLLHGVSAYGYCVESPADWRWHADTEAKTKQ